MEKMEKQKDLKYDNHNSSKEENKMKLFGKGHGYLGLPKRFNIVVRLIFIWVTFGGLGIYLFNISEGWAGIISIACAIMFSAFNNYLKD